MSYRQEVVEKDFSQFSTLNVFETGAMVVKSQKGSSTPIRITSEQDAVLYFGKPSATYNEVFELIAFTRSAPCWAVSAIGDGALFGGVDVKLDSIVGFGVGRDWDTFDYSVVARDAIHNAGTGDGNNATFAGTLTNFPVINTDNIVVKIGGVATDIVSDATGTLTGTAITGGSITLSTGVFTMTFDGTAGTFATLTTDIDLSSGVDLSTGATDKLCSINIDGTTLDVNFGQSATTSQTDIVNAINVAFSETYAVANGNFIGLTGKQASTTGIVSVDDPSTGDSALDLIFDSGGSAISDSGTNPTGSIPAYNSSVTIEYNYSDANVNEISHSIFTTSPYVDDLSCYVISTGGYKFDLYLFQKIESGGYSAINTYSYSLIEEKDAFGNSLYYGDVFDNNPYVQITINPNFVGGTYDLTSTTQVLFTGGLRGDEPEEGDYTTAWNNFQKANKYPAVILMDVAGNSAVTINTLANTYQEYSHGITVVPKGNNATQAIAFRSSLALDTDNVNLYTNWTKIQDDYNNSVAWISNVGSIGRKYALCGDAFDAATPAGIDENNHGGQLADWKVIETEYDYVTEFQELDLAQVNPVVLDETYGLIAEGDRTLQVINSDTSFVGTRRVYNLIIKNIKSQVMRQQIFKLNDSFHQLKAKSLVRGIIDPILADGWIREYNVVCDDSNNTDAVKNERKFVIDIYIKITPNSQKVRLNFTRLSQTQSVVSISAA